MLKLGQKEGRIGSDCAITRLVKGGSHAQLVRLDIVFRSVVFAGMVGTEHLHGRRSGFFRTSAQSPLGALGAPASGVRVDRVSSPSGFSTAVRAGLVPRHSCLPVCRNRGHSSWVAACGDAGLEVGDFLGPQEDLV